MVKSHEDHTCGADGYMVAIAGGVDIHEQLNSGYRPSDLENTNQTPTMQTRKMPKPIKIN